MNNNKTKLKVAVHEYRLDDIDTKLDGIDKRGDRTDRRVGRTEKAVYLIVLMLVGSGVVKIDQIQSFIVLLMRYFV